jgi:hypothetical protein
MILQALDALIGLVKCLLLLFRMCSLSYFFDGLLSFTKIFEIFFFVQDREIIYDFQKAGGVDFVLSLIRYCMQLHEAENGARKIGEKREDGVVGSDVSDEDEGAEDEEKKDGQKKEEKNAEGRQRESMLLDIIMMSVTLLLGACQGMPRRMFGRYIWCSCVSCTD